MSTKRRAETDVTGLRKRPQMEQIIDYLENGQERMKYPDREATFVRNHPYMTHFDFFEMQDEQARAWEKQKLDHEAEQIATDDKSSKAIQQTKKDSSTQDRMFDNDEWGNTMKNAHVIWDAESESVNTSDRNKKDSDAQTMSFALRQQARYPSLGMPRLHYNENTGIPSAPPLTEEERERWQERVRPRTQGSEKARTDRVTGWLPDGQRYHIYIMNTAKQHTQKAIIGGTKGLLKAGLSVGKGALDFADYYGPDLQGKRDETKGYLSELQDRSKEMSDATAAATMDVETQERAEALKKTHE